MTLWDSFVACLRAHRAAPSADTEAAVIASHERFVREFAGSDAETLIAEFRSKLRQAAEADA